MVPLCHIFACHLSPVLTSSTGFQPHLTELLPLHSQEPEKVINSRLISINLFLTLVLHASKMSVLIHRAARVTYYYLPEVGAPLHWDLFNQFEKFTLELTSVYNAAPTFMKRFENGNVLLEVPLCLQILIDENGEVPYKGSTIDVGEALYILDRMTSLACRSPLIKALIFEISLRLAPRRICSGIHESRVNSATKQPALT